MLWLPAVCRKMDIPYCIVKSKSRLGALVHQKTATAICLTAVRPEVRRCFPAPCIAVAHVSLVALLARRAHQHQCCARVPRYN